MATRTVSMPATDQSPPLHDVERGPRNARRGEGGEARWLALGAPLVAVLAGMAAEWLDFRALRVPLLLMVGFGVLATASKVIGARTGWRPFALAVLLGAATWAAGEGVYTIIHVALGHQFHAGRFGPQWSQAVGLIAVHGLFLGVPTGVVAGLILLATARVRQRRTLPAHVPPLHSLERGPGGEA